MDSYERVYQVLSVHNRSAIVQMKSLSQRGTLSQPCRSLLRIPTPPCWTRPEIAWSTLEVLAIVGFTFELSFGPYHLPSQDCIPRPVYKLFAFVWGILGN